MFLLKILAKILVMLVLLAVIVFQWVGIFLSGLAGGILNLLAFLFALTAGLAYLMGLATGPEALKMLSVGFILFIIPHIGN